MTKEKSLIDIYQEGYDCHLYLGKRYSDCPYEKDTQKYHAWREGFRQAVSDGKENKVQ